MSHFTPVHILLILVCFPVFSSFVDGNEDVCLAAPDFATLCTTTYSGVVDGGHCFFLTPTANVNWTEAWDECTAAGGTFAQIYTESEMRKIQTKLKNNPVSTKAWIALRNTKIATGNIVGGSFTHWMSEETTPINEVNVDYTILRNHKKDDGTPGPDYCLELWMSPRLGRMAFGDISCWNRFFALCMVSNAQQNFQLTDGCFTDGIIRSNSGVSFQECTDSCASQSWCRTFNYHTQTSMCELFAIAATDASGSVATGVADCAMFVYIP